MYKLKICKKLIAILKDDVVFKIGTLKDIEDYRLLVEVFNRSYTDL